MEALAKKTNSPLVLLNKPSFKKRKTRSIKRKKKGNPLFCLKLAWGPYPRAKLKLHKLNMSSIFGKRELSPVESLSEDEMEDLLTPEPFWAKSYGSKPKKFNPRFLKLFLSSSGKIKCREKTEASPRYQHKIAKTIRTLRAKGLLSFALPIVAHKRKYDFFSEDY